MGRIFTIQLRYREGDRLYACGTCRTEIAPAAGVYASEVENGRIIRGNFPKVINVYEPDSPRSLGSHKIKELYCVKCGQLLGQKFVEVGGEPVVGEHIYEGAKQLKMDKLKEYRAELKYGRLMGVYVPPGQVHPDAQIQVLAPPPVLIEELDDQEEVANHYVQEDAHYIVEHPDEPDAQNQVPALPPLLMEELHGQEEVDNHHGQEDAHYIVEHPQPDAQIQVPPPPPLLIEELDDQEAVDDHFVQEDVNYIVEEPESDLELDMLE